MKPESKTSETKLMRRMTPAQRKRLKTRQRLLDAVESAERAYIETISVAKALDRSFSDAAMAAQEVHWNLSKALKRLAAHPIFVAAAFDTWFRHYDRSRPRFSIRLDDGEVIDGCYFAVVSKTTPYTYLGERPLHIAPEVGLDTPLALTAFRRMDVVTLLGSAASAMASGRFLRRRRGIVHRHGLERLTFTGDTPFPWQVDGDHLGDAYRLEVAYEPDSLTLVVP